MRERKVARRLSDEIDRMQADARPREGDDSLRPVAVEIEIARHLSQLSERLPPVPAELERRVRAIVRSPPVYPSRSWRSAVWGALAAALVFLVVWSVAPRGQAVWAEMMHSLLGQTRVELTPTLDGRESRLVRETLRDLVAAELLIGRAPALPRALPEGYVLQEIAAVSYPDLPAWISQPFYVELCYGAEDASPGVKLRQYRLLFEQYGGISRVQVASSAVEAFEQVNVAGVTGTLLTLTGDRETYIVLWERDGRLLELQTDVLSRGELLSVAQSIR